jgi:putative endonuclease
MNARATSDSRRKAETGGRRSETLAAIFLRLKGFSILAQRVRTPGGEIDLVARRGALLVFAEVKARKNFDAAVLAVTPAARRRIGRAASLYLSRRPDLARCAVRYDIIAVTGWRVRHLADAWRDDPMR